MNFSTREIRHAFRFLRRNPGFSLAAIVILALGIGANSATFSVLYSLILRPLPYPDADRVGVVWETHLEQGTEQSVMTPANFADLRDGAEGIDLAAFRGKVFNLSGDGRPEQFVGYAVTPEFFDLLGARPHVGRFFEEEDAQEGASPVVVVSYELWQRRYGADPDVVGSTVKINDEFHELVGVAPKGFKFDNPTDIWGPLTVTTQQMETRLGHSLIALGRLEPGVSFERATTELSTLASRISSQYPDKDPGLGVKIIPLHEAFLGAVRPSIFALAGAVAFVLLVACANVGSLWLVRAVTREREIALRAALGGSRQRILGQLLLESLLLSLVGGLLGLMLVPMLLRFVVVLLPEYLPNLDQIGLSPAVVLFASGLAIVTGVLFGLVPGMRAARPDLSAVLKEGGGKASASRLQGFLLRGLVVAETALALTLLIGAGLMVKSALRLQSVDLGFDSEGVLVTRVPLSASKYPAEPEILGFYTALHDKLSSLPGVESVAIGTSPPLDVGGMGNHLVIEGRPMPAAGEIPAVGYRAVGPDYFDTLGIEVEEGREFNDRDREGSPLTVVVNEELVRRHFPGQSPLGERIAFHFDGQEPQWREIVGVAANVHYAGPDAPVEPQVYTPFLQDFFRQASWIVRTTTDPDSLKPAVRAAVFDVDPDQALSGLETMEERLATHLAPRRALTFLVGVVSFLALLLGIAGIYSLVSYSVSQRSREIGIRMALGAGRGQILSQALRQALVLTAVGVVVGALVAISLREILRSLLFDVSATDPLTFVVLALVLMVSGVAASFLPARRASRLDPSETLRAE